MDIKQFKEYVHEFDATVDDNLQFVDDHGTTYIDPVIEVTEDIAVNPDHVGCWMCEGVYIQPEWGWYWDTANKPIRVTAVPVMKTEWKVLNS